MVKLISREALGRSQSREGRLTGSFWWLWSSAARVEVLWSFRVPSATFWWVWVEEEAAGRRSSTASSGGSEYGIGDVGAPVIDRRQEAVGELRESEAKLLVGSAWAERVWRGGSTVSSSSPVFGWTAAVFWGVWVGSWRGCEGNALLECSWC